MLEKDVTFALQGQGPAYQVLYAEIQHKRLLCLRERVHHRSFLCIVRVLLRLNWLLHHIGQTLRRCLVNMNITVNCLRMSRPHPQGLCAAAVRYPEIMYRYFSTRSSCTQK
jgi:hypothetical protein